LDIAAFVLARESAVSYLTPHFDPDVFVSYSHGDPIGGDAPLRDWTHALIRRLRVGLHALKTEFDGLDIWMDPEIDPTAFLTPELRAKAGACGVLMIVMSERYLKSSWCGDELKWFREQFEGRASEGGRVFVIRAQQTEERLWPDFLRDARGHALIGFPFYDPDNGDPWGFQLREPGDDYFKELARLRTWLTRRLRELRERAAKRAEAEAGDATDAASPTPAGPRLVYLHAPVGCETERADLGAVLKSDGIEPLTAPSRRAAGNLGDWQREASERITMAKHCEAMTLLRAGDPDRFLDDLLGIGIEERKRISGVRGAPLPCAVLDKSGEGLPFEIAPFGIERFDVNRTDWRSHFRAWLDSGRAPTAQAAQ
jgi:hypothetical protein